VRVILVETDAETVNK